MQRWQGKAAVIRRALAAGLAVAVLPALGCGSSADDADAPAGDAGAIIQELKGLKPGERLVKSSRVPRFSGPYAFKRGYVFRWQQTDGGRLTVALESRRGSRQQPYQLFNGTGRSGARRVTVRGRLHVHVLEASGAYVLRFTPEPASG